MAIKARLHTDFIHLAGLKTPPAQTYRFSVEDGKDFSANAVFVKLPRPEPETISRLGKKPAKGAHDEAHAGLLWLWENDPQHQWRLYSFEFWAPGRPRDYKLLDAVLEVGSALSRERNLLAQEFLVIFEKGIK